MKLSFLKGFLEGFKQAALRIQYFVNWILLTIIYFVGVFVSKLLAHLKRKELIHDDISSDKVWLDVHREDEKESIYDMF